MRFRLGLFAFSVVAAACSSSATGGGSGAKSGSGGTSTGSGGAGADMPAEATSILPHDTHPSVSPADQKEFETDNLAFAFDLYGKLGAGTTSNVFFSPYSISTAFAMTYAGARGQTATEMAKVLHYSLPNARLATAFDWLALQLDARASQVNSGQQGTPFSLYSANAMWGEKTETWVQSFLDTLAVDYGAGMMLVDFEHDPTGARAAINTWVDAETGGRIPMLLPPMAISSDTRFAIVDALYFHASWAQPFETGLTLSAPFTLGSGMTANVPTMQETSSFAYGEGSYYQAIELPYVGGQVAMDIVLPASDAAIDQLLTSGGFATIVGGFSTQVVSLKLPKFQVAEASFSLKQTLQALGMVTAWGNGADFSAMSPDSLYLSDAFHQTFVKVDENGTEAAAATAVIGADGGVALPPPMPKVMTVDRPFFVAIRDLPTGTILFAGKVVSPEG
jgi:serpin B